MVVLMLAAWGVAAMGVSGCKLFGGKTAPTEEPKGPSGSKGKVTLGQTKQPSAASQPAGPEQARLKLKAGDSTAQGAAFKVFDETGTVAQTGQVPETVRLSANTRYKLAATKPGFKPWEAWQTLGNAESVTEVEVSLQRLEPRRATVTLCTVSGKRATRYCPTTRRKDLRPSEVPAYCTIHGPRRPEVQVTLCTVSGKRATRYCPQTVTRRLPEGKVPGYCTVHTGPQRERTVSVTLCSVSKKRATRYCPSTINRRLAPDEVPGYCRVHGPKRSEAGSGRDSSVGEGQKATKVCPQCGTENRTRAQRCKNCRYHFQ